MSLPTKTMATKKAFVKMGAASRGALRGWLGLTIGLACIWFLAFVALPQGSKLPLVEPVMKAISEADINASAYWYTQSEETPGAAMFVRTRVKEAEQSAR